MSVEKHEKIIFLFNMERTISFAARLDWYHLVNTPLRPVSKPDIMPLLMWINSFAKESFVLTSIFVIVEDGLYRLNSIQPLFWIAFCMEASKYKNRISFKNVKNHEIIAHREKPNRFLTSSQLEPLAGFFV